MLPTNKIRIVGLDIAINNSGIYVQEYEIVNGTLVECSARRLALLSSNKCADKVDIVERYMFPKWDKHPVSFINEYQKIQNANSIADAIFEQTFKIYHRTFSKQMYTMFVIESPPSNFSSQFGRKQYQGNSIVDIIAVNSIVRATLARALVEGNGEIVGIPTSTICAMLDVKVKNNKQLRVDRLLEDHSDIVDTGKLDDIADAYGCVLHGKAHSERAIEFIVKNIEAYNEKMLQ